MRFTKMHGLGNDLIMINGFVETLPADINSYVEKICRRHLGIGADGVVILVKPNGPEAVARYLFYNSDGTQAGMCGNGVRCAALFAKREGITDCCEFAFEVQDGLVYPHIIDEEQQIVQVDMGVPRLLPEEIPAVFSGNRVVNAKMAVQSREFNVTLVSMGNPHCIIFVDDVDSFPVEKIGSQIETHSLFPAKTNVEFIQLMGDNKLKMRVWERGCGETLACGSGACAATVAAILNGYVSDRAEVYLRHGLLNI